MIPFSFSQLSNCPIRNYFKYYSPFKYQIDTYALLLGKITHKLLELYVSNTNKDYIDKLIKTINDTAENCYKDTWSLFKELLTSNHQHLFSENVIATLCKSSTIEEFLLTLKGSKYEMEAHIIFKIWETFKDKSKILSKHALKLYRIGKNYLNSILKSKQHNIKSITPEYQFTINKLSDISKVLDREIVISEDIKDIQFVGYIDLVIETNDNTIHVIDWKTGSYNSAYELQLWLYFLGWMLSKNYSVNYLKNKQVYLTLFYLKEQKEHKIVLDFENDFDTNVNLLLSKTDELINLVYKRRLIEKIIKPINYNLISLQDIIILKQLLSNVQQTKPNTRLDKVKLLKDNFQLINQMLIKPLDSAIIDNIINIYYVFDVENTVNERYCKYCEYNFLCPKGITL